MTVPNTPPDPGPAREVANPAADLAGPTADAAPGAPATPAAPGPYGPPVAPDPYAPPAAPGPYAPPAYAYQPQAAPAHPPLPELRIGALTVLVCLLLGLGMAGLWVWLAPRVPLLVSGDRILYADPEGEQRAGADAVFALVGLGAGVVTALGAFLLTRRRGGGIAVAVGLTVGGLAGSLVGWKVGVRLGPTSDVIAHAKQVGDGHGFDDALRLGAHGALLVWPMTAMVLLLALSAAFGKREQEPPPYWAGTGWPAPAPLRYGPPPAGGPRPTTDPGPAPLPHAEPAPAPAPEAEPRRPAEDRRLPPPA